MSEKEEKKYLQVYLNRLETFFFWRQVEYVKPDPFCTNGGAAAQGSDGNLFFFFIPPCRHPIMSLKALSNARPRPMKP